ncbi:YvrJ family protein [Psychrobacillus sp. NPDC096426]|uniref:YvrJ family protein n=1 Tax=Psychrobacillus sp. NPDC096426 TaxID=3364491 RepID=UPI00382847D0
MIDAGNIVQLIGNFGFPIVVSIYLLHRFENKIASLENAIHSIENVVNSNIEKRKGGE